MSKNLIIVLLVLIMFFCSSCSIGGSRIAVLNKSNEEEIADAMMEEIVSIINDEDKEALKALFANDVLAVVENFDSDFDDLIDFIKGDIISWERDLWCSGSTIDHGKKSVRIESCYRVETDEETYFFFLSDTTEDTIDINNQGLSILQVIKEEDAEITQWQDNFLEGIHIFEGSTESNK